MYRIFYYHENKDRSSGLSTGGYTGSAVYDPLIGVVWIVERTGSLTELPDCEKNLDENGIKGWLGGTREMTRIERINPQHMMKILFKDVDDAYRNQVFYYDFARGYLREKSNWWCVEINLKLDDVIDTINRLGLIRNGMRFEVEDLYQKKEEAESAPAVPEMIVREGVRRKHALIEGIQSLGTSMASFFFPRAFTEGIPDIQGSYEYVIFRRPTVDNEKHHPANNTKSLDIKCEGLCFSSVHALAFWCKDVIDSGVNSPIPFTDRAPDMIEINWKDRRVIGGQVSWSIYDSKEGDQDIQDLPLIAPLPEVAQSKCRQSQCPSEAAKLPPGKHPGLSIALFSAINRERSKHFKNAKGEPAKCEENWSWADWMVALQGEVGELANFLKKMNRGDFGWEPDDVAKFKAEASKEIADIFTYLDLFANAMGIDLQQCVISKFNAVSEKQDLPMFKLPDPDRNILEFPQSDLVHSAPVFVAHESHYFSELFKHDGSFYCMRCGIRLSSDKSSQECPGKSI